ncbi:MAG: YitT family protein [Chloroflexi bacterium]|nr:YitT family protein [Chloroflexota bacterium]MBK6709692.1 YitT family protein [Chloroflexota bacterium]MBK7180890.1 YitT family protein [Chloroflexota bacterium]MBK7918701.1 YitT family protein [Chloroflexota bacterium]MBK8932795.1 YitT family protein [Chloroflexota bacterium]
MTKTEFTNLTKKRWRGSKKLLKREIPRIILLVLGTTFISVGYVLFQVPNQIVAGGLSGIGIIVNSFTGWPLGLMYWVMNIPMLILGFMFLGRWAFLIRTLFAVTIFSFLVDWLQVFLPTVLTPYPVSNDLLLSTIYGGIVGGIGAGLLYRAGGTIGGTSVLGRILQQKTGLPLSQSYIFTDGTIILVAGIVFGWEIAMYGLLLMFINGLASDYVMEGPSTTRVATIITNHPEEVAMAVIKNLHRGASFWPVTGGYTGATRYMITCTVYRSQVVDLKNTIADADPEAFVTIGLSHHALGQGFTPLKRGM